MRSFPTAHAAAKKNRLLLRQDKEFGLVVVDLAKDPLAAGPLARSTTRDSNLDKALHRRNCKKERAGSRDRLVRAPHQVFTADQTLACKTPSVSSSPHCGLCPGHNGCNQSLTNLFRICATNLFHNHADQWPDGVLLAGSEIAGGFRL